MSGIPLEYWTGLGAAPAGRADPAACERLIDAKKRYDTLKAARACSPEAKQARPGDCTKLTSAYSEWNALKAASACRAAPAPAQAARPADGPGRVQVPTGPAPAPATRTLLPSYTIPQRGPFGFRSKLEPVSQMFYRPQPQTQQQGRPALSIRSVPTWAWAAAGTVTLLLLGTAIKKRFF